MTVFNNLAFGPEIASILRKELDLIKEKKVIKSTSQEPVDVKPAISL